jgi:phenylacetate-CoA ligase
MREAIGAAFGAPVFDRYGSREVGDLACEFEPLGGLCVSPVTHVVELLRADGGPAAPGEVGEVVVTSLANHAMPLIRYRIGDMAEWDDRPAPPGAPAWPRLRRVVGRTTDVFRRADGGIVVPEYLIHLVGVVLNRGAIERFQVVQEDYEHVRVRVVASATGGLDHDDEVELADKIRHVMGEACRVDVERVERLDPSPSGKFRTTISKVLVP